MAQVIPDPSPCRPMVADLQKVCGWGEGWGGSVGIADGGCVCVCSPLSSQGSLVKTQSHQSTLLKML